MNYSLGRPVSILYVPQWEHVILLPCSIWACNDPFCACLLDGDEPLLCKFPWWGSFYWWAVFDNPWSSLATLMICTVCWIISKRVWACCYYVGGGGLWLMPSPPQTPYTHTLTREGRGRLRRIPSTTSLYTSVCCWDSC